MEPPLRLLAFLLFLHWGSFQDPTARPLFAKSPICKASITRASLYGYGHASWQRRPIAGRRGVAVLALEHPLGRDAADALFGQRGGDGGIAESSSGGRRCERRGRRSRGRTVDCRGGDEGRGAGLWRAVSASFERDGRRSVGLTWVFTGWCRRRWTMAAVRIEGGDAAGEGGAVGR